MRKTLVAIAAAAAMVPAGAWAKPHHQITDAQRQDCLTIDDDPDGSEWCVKSGKGMTPAQIDAWYAKEAEKAAAEIRAEDEPNDKNCMHQINDFERDRIWYGVGPSEEDCHRFAAEIAAAKAAVEAKNKAFDARVQAHVHHALNEEIMKQCDQMSDTPSIDWTKVAALRGITVSLDDCAKAAAGLAEELKR